MRIRGWHISFVRWGIKFERVNIIRDLYKHAYYSTEDIQRWKEATFYMPEYQPTVSEPEVSAANSERRIQ